MKGEPYLYHLNCVQVQTLNKYEKLPHKYDQIFRTPFYILIKLRKNKVHESFVLCENKVSKVLTEFDQG